MNLEILTESTTVQVIAGIVIGILSFIFGNKRGHKKEKEKRDKTENAEKYKDVKTS